MEITYTQEEIQEVIGALEYIKGQADGRGLKDISDVARGVIYILKGGLPWGSVVEKS